MPYILRLADGWHHAVNRPFNIMSYDKVMPRQNLIVHSKGEEHIRVVQPPRQQFNDVRLSAPENDQPYYLQTYNTVLASQFGKDTPSQFFAAVTQDRVIALPFTEENAQKVIREGWRCGLALQLEEIPAPRKMDFSARGGRGGQKGSELY